MKRILYLILVLSLFSCKKENDVLNYALSYENPVPLDKSHDIPMRGTYVKFSTISGQGLAEYIKTNKVYFDTLNPPVQILYNGSDRIWGISLPLLKPNNTYYWSFSSEIPAGEIKSDIQSFTTSGFYGDWQLDAIADKRGFVDQYQFQNPGDTYDWLHWGSWDAKSFKFIPDGSPFGQLMEYPVNKDSVLSKDTYISEFKITGYQDQIKIYKQEANGFVDVSFSYDVNKGSALVYETKNKTEHAFPAVNVGYMAYYNKVVLLMVKENGIMLIYSRK